uniref:Uncharacterized protein n=1 Tax=Arundo donax TaxID=35708 RepID=A0A0A9C2I6_ARUDO
MLLRPPPSLPRAQPVSPISDVRSSAVIRRSLMRRSGRCSTSALPLPGSRTCQRFASARPQLERGLNFGKVVCTLCQILMPVLAVAGLQGR